MIIAFIAAIIAITSLIYSIRIYILSKRPFFIIDKIKIKNNRNGKIPIRMIIDNITDAPALDFKIYLKMKKNNNDVFESKISRNYISSYAQNLQKQFGQIEKELELTKKSNLILHAGDNLSIYIVIEFKDTLDNTYEENLHLFRKWELEDGHDELIIDVTEQHSIKRKNKIYFF